MAKDSKRGNILCMHIHANRYNPDMGAHCEEIREETEMANLVVFPKWLVYYPGFQRIIFSYRYRNGPREPGYYHIGKREEFYMTPIIFGETADQFLLRN